MRNISPAMSALDWDDGAKVRFQSARNCGASAGASVGTISAKTVSQMMSEPWLAACRRAVMEGPECCGSFSSTSSRTEVSTAVTIANQPQVIIGVGSGGQGAAPAPLLE